ncbi:MAG: protein translocase subunit SecD [Pseudomonadota bacterium]
MNASAIMLRFSRFQTFGILGIILLGALFAAPNFFSDETRGKFPGFLPKSTINLGLDLQGGSYLLLDVNTEKVIDDRLRGFLSDIRREMRPSRASGRERIRIDNLSFNPETDIVTLRLQNEADVAQATERVRELTRGGLALGQRNYNLNSDGLEIRLSLTEEAAQRFAAEAVKDSIEVVRRRIDPAGNKEVSITPQGTNRIVVQVPGDDDPEALKAIINRTGQLSFHRHDPSVDVSDAIAGVLPPGRIYVPYTEAEGPGGLVLFEDAEVSGDMVIDASMSQNVDGGGFQINFSFDSRGALRFGAYTRDNIGSLFAIVLDNEIISSPVIQSAITGGSGRITGSFTAQEAADTALLIRSGALPAELQTVEQRSVGPDLGRDSIEAGTKALIIGFLAVIVYMVISYGRFGIYADIALIANVVLIAGLLSLFGSTLTLPGIAGIVLTIGMAVDANVLIFERIREELRGGKDPIRAAEVGYEKARSAIFDANITTFLAALIMFQLGAGPVRGFAITLAIGVVTSVFTAYVLTRVFAGGYLLGKRPSAMTL